MDTDVEEQEDFAEASLDQPEATLESDMMKAEVAVDVRERDSDGTITEEEEFVKPVPKSRKAVAKKPVVKRAAPKRYYLDLISRKPRRVVSSSDSD